MPSQKPGWPNCYNSNVGCWTTFGAWKGRERESSLMSCPKQTSGRFSGGHVRRVFRKFRQPNCQLEDLWKQHAFIQCTKGSWKISLRDFLVYASSVAHIQRNAYTWCKIGCWFGVCEVVHWKKEFGIFDLNARNRSKIRVSESKGFATTGSQNQYISYAKIVNSHVLVLLPLVRKDMLTMKLPSQSKAISCPIRCAEDIFLNHDWFKEERSTFFFLAVLRRNRRICLPYISYASERHISFFLLDKNLFCLEANFLFLFMVRGDWRMWVDIGIWFEN